MYGVMDKCEYGAYVKNLERVKKNSEIITKRIAQRAIFNTEGEGESNMTYIEIQPDFASQTIKQTIQKSRTSMTGQIKK